MGEFLLSPTVTQLLKPSQDPELYEQALVPRDGDQGGGITSFSSDFEGSEAQREDLIPYRSTLHRGPYCPSNIHIFSSFQSAYQSRYVFGLGLWEALLLRFAIVPDVLPITYLSNLGLTCSRCGKRTMLPFNAAQQLLFWADCPSGLTDH